MKEEPLQSTESPLASQRTELRNTSTLEIMVPSKMPSRFSPRIADVIEAETLRQEADIGETCSFFIADLGRAAMALVSDSLIASCARNGS
jgi:hypothetical protein